MGILRLLLAISVVLAHSTPILGFSFVGGSLAVQAFYIISGFYMSLILNEKYVGQNSSYSLFITNRFLRLYPIYWTVLLLSVVLLVFQGSDQIRELVKYFDVMNIWTIIVLAFTNLFIFFQDAVMFLGMDPATGALFFTTNFRETNPQLYNFLVIPQAWTLGIELMFYLIAPFVLRRGLKVVLVLIAGSLILRLLIYRAGLNFDPWSYRFFPTELMFFFLGYLAYLGYTKVRTYSIDPRLLKLAPVIIVIFTIMFNFLPIPKKTFFYLVAFLVLLPFVFHATKSNKVDTYIGELSYPVYMCHILVLGLLNLIGVPEFFNLGLVLAISSVLFSVVLNEVIAKRIEKLRQARVRSQA